MSPIENFWMPKKSSQKEAERQKIEYDLSREKAGLVENMPITAHEKVEILLVMARAKSAAGIILESDYWQEGTEPKLFDREKLEEITKSLRELGLAYRLKDPIIEKIPLVEDESIPKDELKPEDIINNEREKIEIEIAGNDQLLKEILRVADSGDHAKMGRLYGFPKTAIEEFLKGENGEPVNLIKRADLPEELKKEDWTHFAYFWLSRQNWQEEIKTARKWAEIVKKMSPEIYSEYLDFRKEVVD